MASAEPGAEKPVPSDALVFFGATGDLAYKKIFPSLQNMVRCGFLKVPVIGVAKSGWTIEQLRDRARASLKEYGGGVDEAAFSKLSALLQYIDGDYSDPATFTKLRQALGKAAASGALPRDSAEPLRGRRRAAREVRLRRGRARHRREAVRPQLRDGPPAQPDAAHGVSGGVGLPHRPLSRQGSRREPPLLPFRQHVPRAHLEPQLRRLRPDHDGRAVRRAGPRESSTTRPARSATSSRTTSSRSSGYLAMEPPISVDADRDPRRAGQDLPRDPAAPGRGRRPRPVRRLPQGAGRRARLHGRDLRGRAPRDRLVALGGRAVLHPRRQVPAR